MRKLIALFLAGTVIWGCSSKGPVKLYEGEVSAGSEVRLVLPVELEVVRVDGRKTPRLFTAQDEVVYHLAPGRREIVLKYQAVWTDRMANDEVIRSDLFQVAFEASPGAKVTFVGTLPNSLEAAKAFAKAPKVDLALEGGDGRIASDVLPPSEQTEMFGLFTVGGNKALSNLKYWWERASQEQQAEFLDFVEKEKGGR